MANSLTPRDAHALMEAVVKQATGIETMKATDTSSFVAQAQTALLAGNDRIMDSISQVMDRTIFSTRPFPTGKTPCPCSGTRSPASWLPAMISPA